MMMEPASVSEAKDMAEVEFEGLKVTAQAIEKLEQVLEEVGDKESAVRIVRTATSPNQFQMKVDKVGKNDYTLKRSGNKILIFDQDLRSELDGIIIGTHERSGSVRFTITQQPPLSIEFE
jgi:Fe-S cluster assembly iron-binding protein IscA